MLLVYQEQYPSSRSAIKLAVRSRGTRELFRRMPERTVYLLLAALRKTRRETDSKVRKLKKRSQLPRSLKNPKERRTKGRSPRAATSVEKPYPPSLFLTLSPPSPPRKRGKRERKVREDKLVTHTGELPNARSVCFFFAFVRCRPFCSVFGLCCPPPLPLPVSPLSLA